MKIQELRIGNYVKGIFTDLWDEDGVEQSCVCRIIILDEPAQSGFTKWANSIEEIGKDVEEWNSMGGLILTEEWLLKFGFEVEKNGGIVFASKDDNCKFYVYCENNKTWKIGKYNNGFKHIYYVHQLQNLYFALTGEELVLSSEA